VAQASESESAGNLMADPADVGKGHTLNTTVNSKVNSCTVNSTVNNTVNSTVTSAGNSAVLCDAVAGAATAAGVLWGAQGLPQQSHLPGADAEFKGIQEFKEFQEIQEIQNLQGVVMGQVGGALCESLRLICGAPAGRGAPAGSGGPAGGGVPAGSGGNIAMMLSLCAHWVTAAAACVDASGNSKHWGK